LTDSSRVQKVRGDETDESGAQLLHRDNEQYDPDWTVGSAQVTSSCHVISPVRASQGALESGRATAMGSGHGIRLNAALVTVVDKDA